MSPASEKSEKDKKDKKEKKEKKDSRKDVKEIKKDKKDKKAAAEASAPALGLGACMAGFACAQSLLGEVEDSPSKSSPKKDRR